MAFDVDWTKPPGQRITGWPAAGGISAYQALTAVTPPPPPDLEPERPTVSVAAEIAQRLVDELAGHEHAVQCLRAGLRQQLRDAIAHLDALDVDDQDGRP